MSKKCNLPPTLHHNVQLWVFCRLYCKLISKSEVDYDRNHRFAAAYARIERS